MTMSVRHSKRETIPYLSPTEIDDAMIKDGLSEDVARKKKKNCSVHWIGNLID